MNKVLKWAHGHWIRARLDAPPAIRRQVLPWLYDIADILGLAARWSVTIVESRGQGKDGTLRVAFVNAKTAQASLQRYLFLDEPIERQVGRVPFWRWRELANWPTCDLIVIQGNRRLIGQLPQRSAIVLPQFVHHALDLTGDWPTVEGRIHQSLLRTELRRAQKQGYEFDVSKSDRDFDEFYREIYRPSTRIRHGELSRPMSRYEANENFKRGFLLRVTRGGSWLAGAICKPEDATLLGRILGVRNADQQEMRRGIVYALYYSVTRLAHERGFRAVDFGETGSFLESGMFQFKRRWGTKVFVPSDARLRTWIQTRRDTPAVASFLKENPFVIVDQAGRIHGLIAVDDPTRIPTEARQEWEKRYATPGLESLIVRSISSFVEAERDDLVLPIPVISSRVPYLTPVKRSREEHSRT